MKKVPPLILLVLLLTFVAKAQTFTLRSDELGGQVAAKQLFNGLGVQGANLSPALAWQNAPKGAKSFAVTMYDPTAPTGSGWWHWVVFDIPATVSQLKEGAGTVSAGLLPAGAVQG